jgi:hypothetical protein
MSQIEGSAAVSRNVLTLARFRRRMSEHCCMQDWGWHDPGELCALIAHHRQKTAIVVNRAELVGQWTERLGQFLDLSATPVGTLGAGKDRRGFIVDVVMLQSLARRDAAARLLDDYGLVIVDECHPGACLGTSGEAGRSQAWQAQRRNLAGISRGPPAHK